MKTPEQWAADAYHYWDMSSAERDEDVAAIAVMFRQAVAEEREAIALMAEEDDASMSPAELAIGIRLRTTP